MMRSKKPPRREASSAAIMRFICSTSRFCGIFAVVVCRRRRYPFPALRDSFPLRIRCVPRFVVHVRRERQRSQQRNAHGNGQSAEKCSGHAGDRNQRQEHDDRRQRRADQRNRQFFQRAAGRFKRPFAAIAMQHDVLDDHDGVVDHQPACRREAAQGHHVEALAQDLHGDEGHEDGHGNHQTGHQRRAPIPQEEPDDEPGEQQSNDDRVAHAADRFPDDVGLVVENVADRRPPGRVERRALDFLMNFVGDFHRVAVRLPVDADQHGGLAIRGDHRVDRRRRRRYGPDIPDANRNVVHVLDDDVADLVGRSAPAR